MNNNHSEEKKMPSDGEIDKMNIVEVEEKKNLGNMEKIEKEFADLKEKFFNDKIEALKKEYEMIKNGTHQVFIKKSKELEEIRDHKIWAAEKWKEFQLQNIENIFQAEKSQAEDEFLSDQKALSEKMVNSILEKKKKLIDEKNTLTISDGPEKIIRRTRPKRGKDKENKDQSNYRRRLNPPHISYTLKESEISEDLNLIIKQAPSNSSSKDQNNKSLEVFADRGKLHYFNQVFEKGKDVFIESKSENGRWTGTIVAINPAEIHIRNPDGTKSRFSLHYLRNGKYTITSHPSS